MNDALWAVCFFFLNQNKLLTSFCKIGLVKMEKVIIPSRRKLPVSRRGQIIELIIQAKSEKKSLSRLAASLGLKTQTLHSIWRRKDRILKALESNPNFKAEVIFDLSFCYIFNLFFIL